MHSALRLSAGLAMGLMLWTGTALAQSRPACDPQAKMKTPERVEGEVTKVDVAQGKVTVRQSDGTTHEFQASTETLQGLKEGGRVEAKLREAPNC
jgi:Cu/Ag efflux protein CusF